MKENESSEAVSESESEFDLQVLFFVQEIEQRIRRCEVCLIAVVIASVASYFFAAHRNPSTLVVDCAYALAVTLAMVCARSMFTLHGDLDRLHIAAKTVRQLVPVPAKTIDEVQNQIDAAFIEECETLITLYTSDSKLFGSQCDRIAGMCEDIRLLRFEVNTRSKLAHRAVNMVKSRLVF